MKKLILLSLALIMGLTTMMATDHVASNDFTMAIGETKTFAISLTNERTDYVSFQMDLTLPAGLSLNKAGCSLTSRVTDEDQELTIGKQGENTYRLTSTSFSLTPISGTSGDLITLSVTGQQGFAGGTATITNIRFATTNSQRVTMENVSFNITSPASVVTAPTAKTLTYTGSAQQLVNAGVASGGTMQYSLDGTTYDSDIPTSTNAGTYNVYYKVVGDDNHTDTTPATVSVTIKRAAAAVTTAPTAKTLTYTGAAQQLVNAGVASGGTMQYSLDGTNYASDIPTGTNAGSYNVYYKVVGDDNHTDTTPATVSVTISDASATITFSDANVKALCVANWDTNGDGELSEAEAAAVTSLGEVFKENTTITSFDELQYFTGITSLPNWNAFDGCSSLQSIVIPAGVTAIYGGSFANCSALRHISVDANNSVYDSRNDCNAIIETVTNKLVVGCETTQIPNTITTIGTTSFWGRWGISAMTIPESVTSIEGAAFAFCSSLSSITIPANVTAIGSQAFNNCNNLVSVTVGNPSPVEIDESTFSNRANATLYVPIGSKSAYEATDYWQGFNKIVAIVNLVRNGNLEGENVSCFFSRENFAVSEEIVPSTIVEGAGIGGSRGIVVQSTDNPSEVWNTQFFLRLPQTLPAGTKYHISFDYKADKAASGATEIHAEPSDYITWDALGSLNYTTDWQHFESTGTISAEQSPTDKPMRTIAFNLAETQTATTYYFDNFVFEIDQEHYEPEVSKLTQTLELASLPEMTEGDAAFALPQQTDQGLALVWSVADATIASISGNQLTPLTAGTTTVTATQAGNDTYLPFTKDFTLTVNERQDPDTDISQMDNAIYIIPFTTRAGEDASIEICLKNADAATAYVFDMVLPEGITVALNEKGKYIDALSDRHDDHTRTFNYKGDNTYSLSTLSGNSEELTGNDGAIRLLTLHVADNVDEGVYAIQIKNASYSKTDGTLVTLPNTTSSVTVEDYVLGDVNGNGGVDIGDAVSIVNYLVGKESSTFVAKAADTNKNGQVDIGDAVTIVNFLVGKTESLSRQATAWDEKEPQ